MNYHDTLSFLQSYGVDSFQYCLLDDNLRAWSHFEVYGPDPRLPERPPLPFDAKAFLFEHVGWDGVSLQSAQGKMLAEIAETARSLTKMDTSKLECEINELKNKKDDLEISDPPRLVPLTYNLRRIQIENEWAACKLIKEFAAANKTVPIREWSGMLIGTALKTGLHKSVRDSYSRSCWNCIGEKQNYNWREAISQQD